ncbi:NlpC/P60 family protein [Nitrospirillum amazonense]|uniref:NlpC/P60 family protein n=1 Tax=Nitrospirillum amazonense TaxID=28077 RepID=A0A560EK18_9PROT|nr:NlpC/P60 family protein [Nitrospirillum amazonense]TWB09719.1 NlpC/P60 family protein [Nitrospirillum amazonense]
MSDTLATGPGDTKIVEAAKGVWEKAKGKPYTWNGHTTNGFDCSGFTMYVLKQAYPSLGLDFMTAGSIFASPHFIPVTGTPEAGDLICFRKGPEVPYDHVGIVYDTTHWIGSQTSTGVALVSFNDFFWSKKPHFFIRLVKAIS